MTVSLRPMTTGRLLQAVGHVLSVLILGFFVAWLTVTLVVDLDGDPVTSNNVPSAVLVAEVSTPAEDDENQAPSASELPVGPGRLTRVSRIMGTWLGVGGQARWYRRVRPIRGP